MTTTNGEETPMMIEDMLAEVMDEKPGIELETWDFDMDIKHACDNWYYASVAHADTAQWED